MFEDQSNHARPDRITVAEAEAYTLEDYGLVPDNVRNQMFGIQINDPQTRQPLPDHMYEAWIEKSVAEVEKNLDIVILPRLEVEAHDYNRNTYGSNMFLHTFRKPIIQVNNLQMSYGGQRLQRYPERWLKTYHLAGHIQVQPTPYGIVNSSIIDERMPGSGLPAVVGLPPLTGSRSQASQLFEVEYIAGLVPPKRRGVHKSWEMPPDLWTLIIKKATKEAFQVWGRLVLGPGIAGYQRSIDGIMEAIQTTQSAMYATASAELLLIDQDIEALTSSLRSYYGDSLGFV